MSKKKQTAVCQLKEKIEQLRSDYWERLCPLSAFDETAGNLASQIATIDIILKEVESKLEIEKEQMKESFFVGDDAIFHGVSETDFKSFEQYYTQTYGE